VGEAGGCAGGTVAGWPAGRELGIPVVMPVLGLPGAEAEVWFVAWTLGCGCGCDEPEAAITFLGWL
jgi:hypothetical protein